MASVGKVVSERKAVVVVVGAVVVSAVVGAGVVTTSAAVVDGSAVIGKVVVAIEICDVLASAVGGGAANAAAQYNACARVSPSSTRSVGIWRIRSYAACGCTMAMDPVNKMDVQWSVGLSVNLDTMSSHSCLQKVGVRAINNAGVNGNIWMLWMYLGWPPNHVV